MKINKIDLFTGIGLCLISVWIFFHAMKYTGMGVNSYGPNFFPQAIASFLFIAANCLVYQAIKGRISGTIESINKAGFIKASLTLILAVLYIVSMNFVGFFIATIVFLYTVIFFLGQRRQVILITTSICAASVIYCIFFLFLKIPLPEGIL